MQQPTEGPCGPEHADFPKPTIAAVHGNCIAAGQMLASMCDLIVTGQGARFSDSVARMACVGVEIPVEFWGVGVRKGKELLFTGDRLTAEEGKALGFVNQVVPDDQLEAFTLAMAERIGKAPAGSGWTRSGPPTPPTKTPTCAMASRP